MIGDEKPGVALSAQAGGPGLDGKWWLFAAIGVGTFMSTLDSSVVNIILPVVSRTFGSQLSGIQWVVTIYLLVIAGLSLSFGRLGDLRGHKAVYVWGFVVFVLGSALSGMAPSVAALIAFRGLQALGAAVLVANSPAILTRNYPPSQRGRVLGLQSTMTYLGLTVGPSLGGWLAGQFGWRSVFYVNVPVGLLALYLSVRFIPRDEPSAQAERFDVPGALAFMAGLVALLLALNQGYALGWGSRAVLGLFGLALLSLGGFVLIEWRSKSPMLDLRLFRTRLFSMAVVSAMFNYIGISSVLFLMPFYLQDGRGMSPNAAGLVLTTQPLIMAIAAPLSGTLSDRIGSRLLSTLGMVIMTVGILLLSRLGPGVPPSLIAGALAIVGLGTGMFISPNSSALMGAAPRQRQGVASGVLAEARLVGQVLGIGLAGAIYTTILSRGQAGGANTALFNAVHVSFLVASGVAMLGAIASAGRGRS